MDLITLLSEHRPRWSSQGNVVMDCPFTEKHLHRSGSGQHSLTVWPGIRAYKCFSCQSGGPLLGLLVDKLDLDYFVAVEALSSMPDADERKMRSFELDAIIDMEAPNVYLKRGFTAELLRKFRVGKSLYAPKDKAARRLTTISLYDRGTLKGLQYRQESEAGKIVWNTDGFDSANFLYNYDPRRTEVMLVEGYADVWRMNMYGIHAEGTMGTSMTQGKLRLLQNRKIIYLALDNDLPGIRATEKVYHALKNFVELRFVPYPTKDPDEATKRQILLGRHNWLDYGGYSYQRIVEFQTDDDADNPYLQIQQQEITRAERREEDY